MDLRGSILLSSGSLALIIMTQITLANTIFGAKEFRADLD